MACVRRICEWYSVVVAPDSVSGLFFFKQKSADELRISDWSSDVCSSDLTFLTAPRNRKGTCCKELSVAAAICARCALRACCSAPQSFLMEAGSSADRDRKSVV